MIQEEERVRGRDGGDKRELGGGREGGWGRGKERGMKEKEGGGLLGESAGRHTSGAPGGAISMLCQYSTSIQMLVDLLRISSICI